MIRVCILKSGMTIKAKNVDVRTINSILQSIKGIGAYKCNKSQDEGFAYYRIEESMEKLYEILVELSYEFDLKVD